MSGIPKAPKPPTTLGYYRVLSPTAGVRVSPLCLGTMNFGEGWKMQMGECSKETAFQILDTYYEAGGNFIDTANFYQFEQSEQWLGEWMAARKNRDQLVVATKYTIGYRTIGPEKIKANFQGNSAKSMRLSVESSLKKLGTSYVDLLYVHLWDFSTSAEEVMRAMHQLVSSGKVLYLGSSGMPAWVVTKCNEYARFHGLTPFSVYQGHWSCAFRDFEREILPMCESEGMGLVPWGALGRGQFRTAEEYQKEGRHMGPQDEKHRRVGEKLAEIAARKNTAPTSIALAYVMQKAPYVFPVVGGRKVEHLKKNIEALSLKLTDEEIRDIDDTDSFDVGYPMNFLFESPGNKYRSDMTTKDIWQLATSSLSEDVPKLRPIQPSYEK